MKVMITVTINSATIGPPSQFKTVLDSFAEFLSQSVGKYDVAYGTGWGTGFAIAEVETMEAAWELVMSSPMYPHWTVEVIALADPLKITQSLAANIQLAAAAVGN